MPENIVTDAADVNLTVITADVVLAKYAVEIRRLGKRVKEDVVAIGRYLERAQEHAGRGVWLAWIETEFGWSDQTAYNFIHLYQAQQRPEFQKFWNSDLPLSALYRLAAPNMPEEARQEVANRVEAGERLSCTAVAEAVAQAKDAVNSTGPEGEDIGSEVPLASAAPDHDDADEQNGHGADDYILLELALSEFFAQASGADVFDQIPADRRKEVCRGFLDKLTVPGTLEAMSDEYGRDLRSRVPAPRQGKQHDVGYSVGENDRLRARVEELSNERQRLEINVGGLVSEVEHLKEQLRHGVEAPTADLDLRTYADGILLRGRQS